MANDNAEESKAVYPEEIEPMSWDEVQLAVSTEADAAIRYNRDVLSVDRVERWDRYYGRPLGNEVKGRSKYMSRDLLETIEWIMPTLIKTLASGDPKVKLTIKGQETFVGKALMRKIHEDLSADTQGSMFTVFYQWFKDALVSGTAYIKPFWEVEYSEEDHSMPAVTEEQFNQMSQDDAVEIKKAAIMPGGYSDVHVTIQQLRRDQLVVENVPTWEFIMSRKATSMNDEYLKGHVTYVTVDYLKRVNRAMSQQTGEEYFINLDEVSQDISRFAESDTVNSLNAEKQSYMEFEQYTSAFEDGESKTQLKSMVQLEELYTRLDIDGTGYLRDVICWRANGRLIRWEDNEEGFIAMSAISPIIDCYKFCGMSYADLVIELQNLKTMLFRRLLDNQDWQNMGRWFVRPGAQVDVKALMDNVPGEPIEADPDAVKNMTPEPFHPQNLALFDYIDGVKEQRTGSTKYTQGTDSSTLNKTASGIQMIQSAAMQRIELIARIFAEGLKDFYQKSAMLYQKNMREPFESVVNGEKMMITPEMIQGVVLSRVDMGVEAQIGQAETQRLERMAGTLQSLNKMAPGLFGAQEIHNIAGKYVTAMGYIAAEDFISPLKTFLENTEKTAQQQQEMQQMQVQLEQQKVQLEVQKVEIDQAKQQAVIATSGQRLALDEKKILMSNKLELAKLQEVREHNNDTAEQALLESDRDYKLELAKEQEKRNAGV